MKKINIALILSTCLVFNSYAAPDHYYVISQAGAYGYTGDDTSTGNLPDPINLIYVRYLGNNDGQFQFIWSSGAGHVVLESCRSPCTEVLESQYSGDHLDFAKPGKLTPGHGLWQAGQDAIAGNLKVSMVSGETIPNQFRMKNIQTTEFPPADTHNAVKIESKESDSISEKKSIPIEKDAVLFKNSKRDLDLIDLMARMVKSDGYSCNSISAAMPLIMSQGIKLTCDQFTHIYDIEDKGGNWIVTAE